MRHPEILLCIALGACVPKLQAQAPQTIYSYAVGNWRDGPVVEISPLFQTTEAFTTPQLVAQVRKQWPQAFTDTTDIDVLRFVTREEGQESRTTLKAKYGLRRLPVNMINDPPSITAPADTAR
jgi:hypothetical protein